MTKDDFLEYGLTDKEAQELYDWSIRHDENSTERAIDHADEILNEAGLL